VEKELPDFLPDAAGSRGIITGIGVFIDKDGKDSEQECVAETSSDTHGAADGSTGKSAGYE